MKLSELQIGAPVKETRSGLVFLVAAQNHPGYEGTTLVSRDILRVTCFDAAEPVSKNQNIFSATGKYGNNNYELSNINAYLNSAETYWYKPSHDNDQPPKKGCIRYGDYPIYDHNGFLRDVSPLFVEAMLESNVPTLVRTGKERGEVKNVRTKVFLPSRTEIGWGDESGFAEGSVLPLFEGRNNLLAKPTQEQMAIYGRAWNLGYERGKRAVAPMDNAQLYDPKYGWWYWTRTPHLAYAYLLRVVSPYGAFSYTMAYNDVVGLRPMTNVRSDFELGDGLVLAE